MAHHPFDEFNLDPALAEAVVGVEPGFQLEGIIRLDDPSDIPVEFGVVCRFDRIFTGRFRAADVWTIRRHPNVASLKAARPIGTPEHERLFDVSSGSELPQRAVPPYTGRGSLVAALDFGFDFAHPNFRNADGTTRVLAFWHQGADYDFSHPNSYGYGRVFSRADINRALAAKDPYGALGYHPSISDTGSGSHGTHTLDIAAGNGRVGAPSAAAEADIIFVHLSTPRLDAAGNLGDSVRLLEGLDFVSRTAGELPWVVNLSVGRTAGSKDGTSLVEQGMHECLRMGRGRAIVQSAGNYRSANLTVEGRLQEGESRELRWVTEPGDPTPNEVDIWYSGKDRIAIEMQPPHSTESIRVQLGRVEEIVYDGKVIGRIYHRKNDPNNRDNHCEVFLTTAAPAGTWIVRLVGEYVISGRYHAWIERDIGRRGAQSRFAPEIASERYTLGTIATSPLVITVGAFDAHDPAGSSAPFSSQGPTRDERVDKPELLAPGIAVVAARSIPRRETNQEGLVVARSGTSMAAPHVTGVVAAMYQAAGRRLSIHEIRDCLRRSAVPLEAQEHGAYWGRLNSAEAMRLARGESAAEAIAESAPEDDCPCQYALPAITNVASANASEEAGEAFMDVEAEDLVLQAELALSRSVGARRESEIMFLRELLGSLGWPPAGAELSPARLFRLAADEDAGVGGVLKMIGGPSERTSETLRPGDWLVRVSRGTGDVGHVSVLVSEDLMSRSRIRNEGIPAESSLPGYYGTVIERGAYPHDRSKPFARRFLDGKGQVPAYSVILRPRFRNTDESSSEALAPPVMPSPSWGPQPTGPLVPSVPADPSRGELRKRVGLQMSGNSASTRAFLPERNDKSGVIQLTAKATFGSLLPPRNISFRGRSDPADSVAFGHVVQQPGQGFSTLQLPVMARRPGRARVFVEAVDASGTVIETSAPVELSVPQFFIVTDSDSQLQDLERIVDGRRIAQPAALDSALRELGLLDDKEQILSMIQTAVDRIAGPRAVRTSYGCAAAHNVRFVWRALGQPDDLPAGLMPQFFTQVDLQGYPPRQLGPQFGNTLSQQGPHGSAENPAELITVFPGLFEILLRENTGIPATTPEDKDLRARLKSLGAYWRKKTRDACTRALMRTVVARCVANTICHEAYHSLLTLQPGDQQAMDPGGHLRARSILSVNRDFTARSGVRVTNEREFPAPRSYVLEEPGIGEWQTLPAEYDRRIWTFFPTPPDWPEHRNPGEAAGEEQESNVGEDTPISSDYSGLARESIDLFREEMPDSAEDKPLNDELDTARQVMWEIIRIINQQYSVQDADPDRWKTTQFWFPRYKSLLKEWFLLTYGVEIPKGRMRLQGKDLRDRLEAAIQNTQPLLDVLKQGGGAEWTKQLRKFFYPRVADLDLEVAKTMPRPVIIVPFEFTERPKPVTQDIYLHVTARQKTRPFLLQRGIGGFGVGEAKAGDVFSTSQQDHREVLWSNGFGVFYAQDGVIYAQSAQGFSEDLIMGAFTIAGQNAAGSAIMAQIMVETALSFTPWGFVADGVFALKALTEGDWKGAGLQLLPGLGGKGLGILSKTRAGKRVVRFAKATATVTANFLKGTVRFFARGAYEFRGKWIRGVWAVEETAGKQTYRFFDEAEQVWREAVDGPAYIKCSWCKYTGAGEAGALQGAVDEIVEDILHSSAYASGGKLLVDSALIRDVLKAYGPQGEYVVELIRQTWESLPKKEAVKFFEDTMQIAKTLSPLRGAVEVFEDLASSSVKTARGTMYELRWMEHHVNKIRELGVPVTRGNWVGKGVDVVLKNNEHIELKSFQWASEVYQKNPERAMAGLTRQVLSRLEYPDVVRVTVVFDSSYKMPAAFKEALQDIKAAIQELHPRAEVNFVTWP